MEKTTTIVKKVQPKSGKGTKNRSGKRNQNKKLSMANAVKKVTQQLKNRLQVSSLLKLGRQKTFNCGDYLYCLQYPALGVNGKVPGQFGKATLTKNVHCTVSITAGALGFAAICFVPYFMHDDATATTNLTVMNGATYDGVAVFTNWVGQATPMTLPAGNVQEYRLVGAEMHVVGQQPLTTANGKIMGGLTDISYSSTTVGGAGTVPNALATNSVVNNFRPFAEADCCIPENLRLVWRPVDDLDFGMYDINEMENATAYRETALVANIVGAPAGAKFNLELYWIFEYVPQPGSINTGSGSYCEDSRRPADLIKPLLNNDKIWAHTFVGAHAHAQDTRNLNVQSLQTKTKQQSFLGRPKDFDEFGYPKGYYPY